MTALSGIRIVELAESPAGEFCGKLLADFGAEVVKVERLGSGSPTRGLSRVPGHDDHPFEASSLFAFLNTNKKSIALDLADARDAARLRELLADAAAVIDDRGPEAAAALGLSPATLARHYPELVCCLITPFGYDAPAEWAVAKSLNVFHASGWGYHTPSHADPTQPPLKGAGCYNADFEGGLDAAIAVLACLYRQAAKGVGEFVDISQQSALLSRIDSVIGLFLAGEDTPRNSRHAYDMPGPAASYACDDGNVYLFMTSRAHWLGLCKLMGEPEWAKDYDENWLEFGITDERVAHFQRHFAEWIADKSKAVVSEEAQKLGVALVPVNGPADLLDSPQFQHRGFFQSLDHPVLGEVLYPTVPYLLSRTPVRLDSAAPRLGEHSEEVPGKGAVSARRAVPARAATPPPARDRGGPLAGVRVVELTKVWAGPYAGKLLSFLGAEVIKVESRHNLDEMRAYGGGDIDKAPIFRSLNHEILSAQFNLKSDEGVARLKELIARSDIVINNLRHGALERMGLDYEGMRALRSDIISVSLKMYGNAGPLAYQTGYAPCFAALSGMSGLVGYEGEAPRNVNIRYGDSTAGAAVVLGALAALVHRERTGEGHFVDVSAVEAMTSLIGDSLLRYTLTGEAPGPDGNYHPDMAPHGCYPCRDARWLSVAVASDSEWRCFCEVLGADALAADARFASLAGRQAHRHAIDAAIAKLTRECDAIELAGQLRVAGVGAFVSIDTMDLVGDAHLWRRGDLLEVSDAHGARPIVGPSWRMTRSPVRIERGAPLLGEHNDHVYGTLLGLSEAEREDLRKRDVMR
jgi:crotonobetainyl-CoA:carnitine CoA-transferase CaiB-like acyl-CoA transferase